jgi:hypothetical protein
MCVSNSSNECFLCKRQKAENQFLTLNTINSMEEQSQSIQPQLTFGQKAVGLRFNPSQ